LTGMFDELPLERPDKVRRPDLAEAP
jgi:hypothetical protein